MMENNIMVDDFYKRLTEDERQVCDLCRDWNLENCEKCTFASRKSYKNEQEEFNDNSRKMAR